MTLLKNLFARAEKMDPELRCIWAGEHSGGLVCLVEIERGCGHIENPVPTCLGHVQVLLNTGGVARRPAPCPDADCEVISIARVVNTRDIPG